MAKISTYPVISIPTFNDLLIGTDVENLNETKNFSISDISSLIITGNYVPYIGANQDTFLGAFNISANSFINTNGTASDFLKADGSLDSTVYQPAGAYITGLTGEASASGPGVANVVLNNGAVIGKVLTGLTITGGSISSTDNILQAFGKLQNQVNGLFGGAIYQGTWDAATNTPLIQSGIGTQGYYYIVNVAGSTTIDGISDWNVGDWIIFDGTAWQQVDNTDTVVSVNGQVGIVVLTTTDISEGTNLYYTDSRARQAISLTTTGNSGASTYDSITGLFNIPNYTLSGLGGVPSTRELTINGTVYDLSADRSWSVGTVTSVGTSGPLTGGTITGSGTIGITQAGVSSDGYLSSTDWNTFNNKQDALINPVTGTGTVYYLPMWSGITSLTDSILSYSSNVVTFNYNAVTGGTVNYTNTSGTPYTYTIQMNNTGSPRQTYHAYTDGNILEQINGNVVSKILQSGQLALPFYTSTSSFSGTAAGYLGFDSSGNILSVAIPSLTGYVPYIGATQNVDLGEYELKAGQLTLDITPTGTASVGTTRWNDAIGSSETTLKGGTVILKNGVDLVARVVNKVTPNQTLTKAQYQAVRVAGAQGQRLAVELAQADGDPNSAETLGLVTETIPTNQEGFIITVGNLQGINTTGSLQGESWNDGDVLYLSPITPGAVTNIKPNASTGHIVVMGYVEYAHINNGKIYVKIMNGWELDELHNVYINTPLNNQGLFYTSSTQLWENKSIDTALGYTPVPTTRQLTINGTAYDLSADRSWSVGTISSLNGLSAATQTFATGTSGTDFNISSVTSTHTFNIPSASATARGLITATTQTIGGAKTFTNSITTPSVYLTNMTGGSGALYYSTSESRLTLANYNAGGKLMFEVNGGQYTVAFNSNLTVQLLGYTTNGILKTSSSNGTLIVDTTSYIPQSRTLTINGTTYDLSADRTWSVGTVTSVDMTVPTGFSIGGNPITTNGTFALTFASGYSLPTNVKQANWDTAYDNRITSLTTTGTSGAATLVSNVLNIPQYQAQGNYITSLTGEATASGPGAASVTLGNAAVTGKILTGLTVTGTTISATDSILSAFGKLQGQINDLVGGLQYQGTWNASTNTPTITSGVGTDGYFYIVSVAGTTNIDGINDWQIGDWIVFHGTAWQKVDNTDSVTSVNGFTGAVTLTTTNISEGTNLYFTDSRARSAISLTTTGNSGASTYSNITGILNVPQYTLAGLGGVPDTRQLTINGTAYDLSANRSWSVGTITSISTTGPITGGTITSTGTIGITQSSSTTNGYLSSTDWSTFNNKQNTITLTTTGNNGSATLVGATLNIPSYSISGLGGVPDSRTLTINGTSYDLTANRTWSVGTITSITFSGPLTGGTITGSGTVGITQAGVSTDGYLSSTDWNTFNNKQNAITLTTTGTSGAATLVGSTLNIPQYQDVLTNPVTGTGTTNEISYWTSSSSIGSLTTATYPSLTELSYVKGVTSSIQTQINGKFTLPSLTSGSVLFSDGTTIAQDNANLFWNNSNKRLGVGLNGATAPRATLHVGWWQADTDGGTQTVRIGTALGAAGSIVDALHLDSSPSTSSYNQGLSMTFGVKSTIFGEYTSRIVHYGYNTSTRGSRLQFQSHATSQGVWNTGILINESGQVGINTSSPSFGLDVSGTGRYTGAVTITAANSTTTGGGQLYLNGATGNRIDFNTNGVNAPAFTTRSAGTKIVLYPIISSTQVDYALGIESGTLWSSVPEALASNQFKWYAGTTNVATLTGTGTFTATTLVKSGGTAAQILAANGTVITAGTNITISGGVISANDTDTGITSLNGLTALTQTFATGTSGTDFNISSVTSTHTFNLPTASSTNRGALSSADWTTFNNKPSVNIYTGDGTLTSNRTITQSGYTINFDERISIDSIDITNSGNYYSVYATIDGASGITGSGDYNVGIGYGVGPFAGDDNVGIGYYSLSSITSGSENTAIGSESLNNITTGIGNIGVGSYSGDGITTGSYNTIIGGSLGVSFSTAMSNNIILADGQGNIRFRDDSTNTILSRLSGTGTRMVVAGTNGELSTQAILSSPISGTGTTNYLAKFTSASVIGDGLLYDSGSAIGLGTSSINASALFQMDSTTKGFLPPRMTSVQRTAIATPAQGLIVYQTDSVIGLYIYANSTWRSLTMV